MPRVAVRDAGKTRSGGIGEQACDWPIPARPLDYLTFDTPGTTVLYWVSVSLVVAGLFVSRLLPCIDYPQHLALSDVARRLADPGSPVNAEFQANYFTYNGLFHVLVSWLSRVVDIALAGRVVVVLSLAAMAGAVVALTRVLRRPPIHAALFVPVLFSFALGWGFVNYVLATAIAAWTLVLVGRATVQASTSLAAVIAAMGLACAFAHVLGMIIACILASALACELAWKTTPPIAATRRRLSRAVRRAATATWPLALGGVYCLLVYRRQYAWAPSLYRDPILEGTAPPVWRKVLWFGRYALDLFRDGSDQILLWSALGTMAAAALLAWGRGRKEGGAVDTTPPPIVSPLVLSLVAYLLTPTVLVGTHLIFQRLGQWVVLGAALATPSFSGSTARRARRWISCIGLLTGANVLLHCVLYARETNDAARVIDDLPEGGSATTVNLDPGTRAFGEGTLTHLAAYYAALKGGRWAFSFARYLSVPVRFRPGTQPAWPARGWEFRGAAYDPRCKYARAFPLVIVKAPPNVPDDPAGEGVVRRLVFHADSDAVRLLSHHGRFWAFDTTGVPDDGSS
jgi:hypothetical protein